MKFWAFDTETINRPGHGEACLLIKMTPEGPKFHEFPQSFDDIFDFLRGNLALAWNLDFDVRAVCHPAFLDDTALENLGLYGRAQLGPYKFQYVPSKFLDCWTSKARFSIYDLKQFYGSSLDAASKAHLPEAAQKIEIPKGWYNEMDTCLRDSRRDRVLSYAARDVTATQALADKLLNSISNLGLKPRRLSSCASLARLKYGRVLKRVKPPVYVNRLFQRSFFGGRIETRLLGRVGPCDLYDIHSAYPSVISLLVDPKKGDWIETDDYRWTFQKADYGHYEIAAEIPLHLPWGPLACRRGARVIYPVGVVHTACGVSAIEALRKAGFRFRVKRAYEFFARNRTPIFSEIETLYLGRKDPGVSLAIKLLLNSIYGLCAEARHMNSNADFVMTGVRGVGDHLVRSWESFGSMTNFVLAQHITESIRMKLWEVLQNVGTRAAFVATDGVLLRGSFPGDVGDGLGRWGLKGTYDSGVLLGCGRYLLANSGRPPETHLRGFPARAETWASLEKCKRRYLNIPCLETDSLRQWAGAFSDDLNVLRNFKRRLIIQDDKRHWPRKFATIGHAFKETIESQPFIMGSPKELETSCLLTPTPTRPSKISGQALQTCRAS